MTKTIICPECDGHGHINRGSANSTWSVLCSRCDGHGVLNVPMTNADHIRSMSDEELAALFSGFCANAEECSRCKLYSGSCAESDQLRDWKRWMNEPVES